MANIFDDQDRVRFVLSQDNELEGTTHRFTKEFDEEPALEELVPLLFDFLRGLGYMNEGIADAFASIADEYGQL